MSSDGWLWTGLRVHGETVVQCISPTAQLRLYCRLTNSRVVPVARESDVPDAMSCIYSLRHSLPVLPWHFVPGDYASESGPLMGRSARVSTLLLNLWTCRHPELLWTVFLPETGAKTGEGGVTQRLWPVGDTMKGLPRTQQGQFP